MGAQEKSQVSSNSMQLQRVKVYHLEGDGKWDDRGTGHVTVDYLERSEDLGLFIMDEDDSETLLSHRISPDDIYRKQEDTIISWRDPEYSTELALSFQETTGCSYIWDQICNAQRRLQFGTLNDETFHNMNSELRELPAVELPTLPLILKTVTECGVADQMRLVDLLINDQNFFRKLMDLFRACEDLENVDGLRMIHKIVRGIILLNSPQIFEKIFGDDFIMDVIGSLEYDPEVQKIQNHRDFFKEHVVFKEAIPIKDPLVLSKIHQTYRVSYLKDVVLTRVLDEGTIANLNSIIHTNNAVVVSLLKDDNTFIQELFARLRSPTTSPESKKNMVYFLHEFCSLSKSLQVVQQLRLFRDLMNEGVFDIVTDSLKSQDKKFILTGTDILILFLNQDPNLLRSYVVCQEGIPLLGLLVKGMITDFGEDMHCQFLEILRSLLDSYTLSGAQRDNMIEIFFEKHMGELINVVTASCPVESECQPSKPSGCDGKLENQISAKPEILSNICELFCFCVLHHPYRIKCNFLLNNLVDKVVLLTHRREKHLVVAAIRFVRTLLSRHDEHVINHLIKNNLFKPIIGAFNCNGKRYNLLHSAVLELLEYIRKENLKPLLKYIFDSFWKDLVKFEHLTSVQSFKVKYDQYMEPSGPKSTGGVSDSRKRIDERALEKEEEYFNGDSDEEDTASASQIRKKQDPQSLSNGDSASHQKPSSKSGGLVDYDDDDNKDYRPPPKKQTQKSEEDDGTTDSLLVKRKSPSKDKEHDPSKKQRLGKHPKSRGSVFAALCSTLSHAVLPGKKIISNTDLAPSSDGDQGSCEENDDKTETSVSKICPDDGSNSEENSENRREKEHDSCNSDLGATENGHASSGDSPLISPKSPAEITINGNAS